MKKFICLILILSAAFPLVFAGGSGERSSSRKIVIYTSMYEDINDTISRELKKRFRNINIEFVYGGTGILQARIASEQASGRLGCDILMVAEPSYAFYLKNYNMLHSYKSREAANLAYDYDPEGFWYPVRVSNMVLAFNPQRNARESVPNTFRNFAFDTRVRGALSMRNPLVSGTTLTAIIALKDRYGYEYFDALGAQRVAIDYGSEESLRKLDAGQSRVVMILEESILKAKEQNSSALEVIYPADGTIIIPSPIMIINNRWSANRNAKTAEAIADWFLSEEGQNAIVDGWMHSVRRDFPRIPAGSIPMSEIQRNTMPVSWENVLQQRDDIRHRFESNVMAGNR